MVVWQGTQVIKPSRDVDIEDGGNAIIITFVGDEHEEEDDGFFVRLQSWSERGNPSTEHDLINDLIRWGRVRVTVELVGDRPHQEGQ